MNKKLSALLLLLVVAASCTQHTTKLLTTGIQGHWKLTATLADIGNGKATWTPQPRDSKEYAKFNADGTIEGTALTDATRYKIIDSARMELTIQHNAEPITYRYQLSGNTLTLQPPCREACGIRFVRMK